MNEEKKKEVVRGVEEEEMWKNFEDKENVKTKTIRDYANIMRHLVEKGSKQGRGSSLEHLLPLFQLILPPTQV